MYKKELIAKYTDPVFNTVKNSFEQRSDDFPVLMLPVRLETRYMNETRYIKSTVPGKSKLNSALQKIYKLIFDIRVWIPKVQGLSNSQVINKLASFQGNFQTIKTKLKGIPSISGDDRRILRDAASDLNEELSKLNFSTSQARNKHEALLTENESLQKDIEQLSSPSSSSNQKGYDFLNALGTIEKEIDSIYVKRSATPFNLDAKLDGIDIQINHIYELINEPDFKATSGTIQKISSKISFIKRQQKNSSIKLINYKTGYTGTRNLNTDEYVLRGKINALKTRVDEEHVPYMELLDKLKKYPTRRLMYRINKAHLLLRADNNTGYSGYVDLMDTKLWLYDQLHAIRERAHRPLDGDFEDISSVKTSYFKLKNEIERFIRKSKKIKPNDRYKKAALTRLKTHLTEEYLDDLEDLLPGKKTIDQQAFSTTKVRVTSTAVAKTEVDLKNARDFVKNANGKVDVVVHEINEKLTEIKQKISVSATNTILIPQVQQKALRSTLDSLKGQMYNMSQRNGVTNNHPKMQENNNLIAELEDLVEEQQLDVYDKRDRFYDDFKKRITFTIKAETVKELWVRIYPDDIAIDNHDERITDEEETIAQDYYYEVYSKPATEREEYKLGAWRAAAASLGVRRAAYIVKKLEPQEVINDNVEEVKNQINSLVEEFSKFTRRKSRLTKKNKELYKDKKFEENLDALKGRLQNSLSTNAFTKCAENKASLDSFLEILKSLNKILLNESKQELSSADRNKIQSLQVKIQDAGNLVVGFYKQHLEDLNIPFKPSLSFPQIEKKSKTWDRAGITEVMPDRFVVVTKKGGSYDQIVVGKPIPKPLQVGISPEGDQADRFNYLENGDLEVPDEIRWLFDFDAAVNAGMAVRIPLQDNDFNDKIDLVMAVGVQDTEAEIGQEAIDKLLANHLYSSGGLEYLPVGTATNNTENVKSPYKAIDNDYDEAFDLFFNQTATYLNYTLTNELKMNDGQFFKDALGIPNEIADFIRNHDKTDIAEGRAMNRALYNVTIKYYMSIMVDNLVNGNDVGRTLPFFMENVSAVGNVPAFRVDGQPYGVLPITPYKDYKVSESTNKGTEGSYVKTLKIFLNATREAFNNFSQKPQTINGTKYENDPQKEFINILGLEPFSKEFFYRFGTNLSSRWNEESSETLEFPVNWDNIEGSHTPSQVATHYDYLLKKLGHTTPETRAWAIKKSKAYVNRYMQGNYIQGPVVQDEKLGTEKLAPIIDGENEDDNYIDWLIQNASREILRLLEIEDLPKALVEGEEETQTTLLLLMLRGGLLYDSSDNAIRALEVIKELDVKKLERLLANHLDLCSYRLDAWLGALANRRLRELRVSKPTGTYIGAYGFVQNLVPAEPQVRAQNLPKGLTPENGSEVFKGGDNQGFIHGPSMNHAVTAAVLRAGYNSLKSRDDNNNALAINLSSSRVRKALSLLEGVSNGQEAGALLGYMYERALHDKYTDGSNQPLEMDVYIYRLRRQFPTFGDMPENSDVNLQQDENVKAANVLDGLAMIDYFEKELESAGLLDGNKTFVEMIIDDSSSTPVFRGHPWGFSNEVPTPANPPQNSNATKERLKLRAMIHELDNMADAFDSLGDLMTSEGVYQLVRGNHVRASAVLNALADGKVPLDPEIISSMRQGVMVTHRSVMNFSPTNNQNSPWPNVAMSPRALAEPAINNWLAQQIGNPDHVDWFASFDKTETHLTLEDLNMQPIDLVLLVASGGEDGLAELEMRCANYLLTHGASEGDEIELNFNLHSPAVNASFGEISSLLHNLGKTILTARVADARDFRTAEDENNFELTAAGINTADFKTRIESALADYETLLASLATFESTKTSYSASETTLAYNKLAELSSWGFLGFYPKNDEKDDVLAMASKIISAKTIMTQNIAFTQSSLAALDLELDHAKWISVCTEIAGKLFGNGFKLMPNFTTTNSVDLRLQLDMQNDQGILRNHSEGYLDEWLSSIALVRNRLAPLESCRLLTSVLHNQQESISVAQLPYTEPANIIDRDYWIGAEFPATFEPDGDRLSLISVGHQHIGATSCGLVLDEWMEIIPDKKETTGIALHFNQPDARAPQTILLAVPPEKTGKWEMEDLLLTVEEALEMAKLRAVEPEHVDFSMFSQLLPATATLAFGHDELARRLNPDYKGDNADQDLGLYVDYTTVNHGVEPSNTSNN